MRYENLFIAGAAAHLPAVTGVDDAVAAGLYDEEEQDATGQYGVAIAGPDDSQPEMAARAGRAALERSGHKPGEVGLLLHAVTNYNGLDSWNAAAYLQQQVLDGAGTAFEIHQLSNGAMAAVDLAGCHLAATPDSEAVLITASERFAEPVWNRWKSSWGLVFADGAGALVLSRRGGFARVVSVVTVSDPGLEILHRGELPFGPSSDPTLYPIDLRARTLDSSRLIDFDEVGERLRTGMRTAADGAATEAGVAIDGFDHYVVPHFGRELLRRECLDVLGIGLERTTWKWAMGVGHLGAADQSAGLAHLREAERLKPGQRVLMIGVGGGFNWTCVALEVLAETDS